jgi:hypothetical protein
MNRLAIGAALGGLAVYLYDPELGENRRGRLSSFWQENRNGALQAGRTASETIDSARPLARRITKAIGRGSWPPAIDRGRPTASLARLIGAAALGGALVYFMDPVKGSARRLQALETGRSAVRQIANIVTPVRGQIGDQVSNAVERIKSKVS